MKTYIKNFISVILISLFFASCQDEAVQIDIPDSLETITANSTLSNLMLRTSANATSDDDLLDNASCFSVELPVTVVIGNITITIENEEGLDELEELLENFEDEIPEFVFPITIISADYTETVIENEVQLEALIESCIEDNSIECVDFVYPISFSELNTDFVIINTVIINSNAELYAYLEDLDDDDANLVALNFPVTLQFANGETLEVNSNLELSDAISSIDDDCDIDDVENCDADQIRQSLKQCVWDLDDEFNDFDSLTATFNEDFTLEINGPDLNEPITGIWEIIDSSDNDDIYLFISELSALSDDLGGDWLVIECDDDELTIQKGDFVLELDQDCDEDDLDCSAEDLSEDLTECYWFANSELLGDTETKFTFNENGNVSVYLNNEFVEVGVWNIGATNSDLTLVLNLTDNYEVLSGTWTVVQCYDGFYSFINEDNKTLMLEQECFDNVNPFECYPEDGVVLDECDEDNDGFAVFNIYEAVPSCDVNVPVQITFHLSAAGAEGNTDFLEGGTAFTNTSNPQVVYIKVALFNNPDEFLIYPVELIVEDCNGSNPFECFESFDAVLEQCDDNNDGIETFNLPIAYDNCTSTADVVTYYVSLADAESQTNQIVNPEAYTSNNPVQTIYVRVEIDSQVEIFQLLIKIVDCQQSGCSFEGFNTNLQECEWTITSYAGDESFNIFSINFMDNNELTISSDNETYTGNWSSDLDGFIYVEFSNISGGNVQIFNGINFKVVECTDNQVIFHDNSNSDNELVLDRTCE